MNTDDSYRDERRLSAIDPEFLAWIEEGMARLGAQPADDDDEDDGPPWDEAQPAGPADPGGPPGVPGR